MGTRGKKKKRAGKRKREREQQQKKGEEEVQKQGPTGYVDLKGVKRVIGGDLRSCLHDAVLNGALRVGAPLEKEELYENVPPKRTTDTPLWDVLQASCVQRVLTFKKQDFFREKGGPEYALLKNTSGDVFLVLCTVQGFSEKTEHTFVYDSGFWRADEPTCLGALIDNRVEGHTRMLEDRDRRTKENARELLNEYFQGTTWIHGVYKMILK